MTQNEIVSHNLQLVMDALSEDEYMEFMDEFIGTDWLFLTNTAFLSSKLVLDYAFDWDAAEHGRAYWESIWERLQDDNKHK